MSWAKIGGITIFVIGALIVSQTYEVLAAAFLGILFALTLNWPAAWIRSRWRFPVWTATILAMLMTLTVLAGLGFLIGPPLVRQADDLRRQLPAAAEQSVEWLNERKWGRSIVTRAKGIFDMSPDRDHGDAHRGQQSLGHAFRAEPDRMHRFVEEDGLGESEDAPAPNGSEDGSTREAGESMDEESEDDNQADDGDGNDDDEAGEDINGILMLMLEHLAALLSVTVTTVMLSVVTLMVALYVSLNPDVHCRGILWMIPAPNQAVAKMTMNRIGATLRWWMLGKLVSMLVIGIFTSLGMWLIGMPAPLALGALAGLLSFVPNIGPIIAAVPGLLLAVGYGPWIWFGALGVYVTAQVIESSLVSPLVDQFTVRIPPAVLIVFQLVMAFLTGAWGVLIATPLLVVILVLVQQLYIRNYIHQPIKVIGSTEEDRRDEESDQHWGKP